MGGIRGLRLVVILLSLVMLAGLAPMGTGSPSRVDAQGVVSPWVPAGLVEIERGSRSLDQIADGFPNPDDARIFLFSWGFGGNVYFNYAGETNAGTTSLEVSLHLFDSSFSAADALAYYAAGRVESLGLDPIPVAVIGDEVLAVAGDRDGASEVTFYVRTGTVLVRVSAVAPSGDPYDDAMQTASQFIDVVGTAPDDSSPRNVDDLLLTLFDLAPGFVISDEGTRDQADIASTFLRPAEADDVLSSTGFRQNVYRYFTRDASQSPYPGAATRIEVSLHLFDDWRGASDALLYYADGRAEAIGIRPSAIYDIGDGAIVLVGAAPGGGIESTVYLLVGNVLARISATAPDGDPSADALATAFVIVGRAG
ncbi:MAG TPA: hypothetical protein VGT61_00860 [Thermomicrobiales bacterium]|jgi:hypothetical protein|nr:hypothetical protein [Thermomicrobiales bacterium]